MLKRCLVVFGIISALMAPLGVMHIWNHRIAPIPASVDLSKIIIGETDVDNFEKWVPGSTKLHWCTESSVGIYIKTPSIWYSRDVSIEGKYYGVNTGYESKGRLYDGNSKIRSIEIVTYSKFNPYDGNWIEKIMGYLLEWDYEFFG